MAVAPLAVWTGEIQPQPPATVLPHVTDQETPSESTSFATVALTGACVVAVMLPGRVCPQVRDGDCATIVVGAEA